jgi:hypothetical protein
VAIACEGGGINEGSLIGENELKETVPIGGEFQETLEYLSDGGPANTGAMTLAPPTGFTEAIGTTCEGATLTNNGKCFVKLKCTEKGKSGIATVTGTATPVKWWKRKVKCE